MDERELIARLQKRDEAAFEELIRQYEKKVYSLCFRMCGNSEDAEEAAQDAFLALWRGIDRFRQESSLSTWIYRLATNACIDTLRRRKKQSGSVSLDDEELFVDAVDTSPQPQETVEHREAQKLLQEGLSALPEEYRKVLILREIEGLSYTEIAESASIEWARSNRASAGADHFCATFYPETGTFLKLLRQKLQNVIVRR